LESSVGQGSRFTLLLPELISDYQLAVSRQSAASKEIMPADKVEPVDWDEAVLGNKFDLAGKKLLLVDNDIRNLYSLSNLLESYGIQVVHAETGVGAIGELKQHPQVDLIIMDVMMPEMDGYDAIPSIRAIPEFEEIPIIALTAKTTKEDKEKCIGAGASDYLTKPVQVEQLMSIINVWLLT
jgi:two-component system chemotaxis sensor kinase CheA